MEANFILFISLALVCGRGRLGKDRRLCVGQNVINLSLIDSDRIYFQLKLWEIKGRTTTMTTRCRTVTSLRWRSNEAIVDLASLKSSWSRPLDPWSSASTLNMCRFMFASAIELLSICTRTR